MDNIFSEIPEFEILRNEPLSRHSRFGIGGPAAVLADTSDASAFARGLNLARMSGVPLAVIGGGSNLVVADDGFDGIVLRYRGSKITQIGNRVIAESGAELQALVDFTVDRGLAGIEKMTGIPGWVGGAVYGNAGAYGHSISAHLVSVRFLNSGEETVMDRDECAFAYRESIFKQRKDWIILSATFELSAGDAAELRRSADDIRRTRDAKYPPTMKCAGSIFKNCILTELPESASSQVPAEVVREGKVPSAWFLEQAGAKGIRRGDIQVAEYHANLIYNDGAGTAADLRDVIFELKDRVRARFGFDLEEEVQFLG